MKNIILIILTFIVHISYAQMEQLVNQKITDEFIEKYNLDDFEAIFSMFSAEMATALPKSETKEFLKDLKDASGNITSRKFLSYEYGTFASYKTTFEREEYLLNISIDEKLKVNGLFIKPFSESHHPTDLIINDLSNLDTIISEEQSQIVIENLQSFPNQTEFSIAIIHNGVPHFYGVKKNNDSLITVQNQNSIFQIGSITKVFTSTLLANYIKEGKINLDDHINQYLNLPFYKDQKLKFIHLANHTSGLPRLPSNLDLAKIDISNPYKNYRKKELEDFLMNHIIIESPGEYQYSNVGAGLLGYTLSELSTQSYAQLLQDKIFSRFNMEYSSANSESVPNNLVKGLDNNGNEIPNWDFAVLAGAGSIYSTTQDLTKFVLAQFDLTNAELNLTRKVTHTINENMDIGLGWHILKKEFDNYWYWHNGGTSGYTSSIVFDVNSQNGIIILSNVSAYHPDQGNIDNICFELMNSLKKN